MLRDNGRRRILVPAAKPDPTGLSKQIDPSSFTLEDLRRPLPIPSSDPPSECNTEPTVAYPKLERIRILDLSIVGRATVLPSLGPSRPGAVSILADPP